jgi:hypothetical protein
MNNSRFENSGMNNAPTSSHVLHRTPETVTVAQAGAHDTPALEANAGMP